MKKQDLQNEKLDRAGSRLIEAARVRSDKIEEIIASPQLFNSVKARIKVEESKCRRKISVFDWAGFGFWNWQKAGAAFAVAAFLFFGVSGILVFRKHDSSTTPQTVATEAQSRSTAVTALQSPLNPDTSPEKQSSDEVMNEPQKYIQKAAFKPQAAGSRKSIQRARVIKQERHQQEKEIEGEFIQLTFAGNLEQTSEDEQIIRVELPRSSLTTLGVSAPAENENGKVKTDLLIGSDGVVRAVRLIK